jgi:hypothetical protein
MLKELIQRMVRNDEAVITAAVAGPQSGDNELVLAAKILAALTGSGAKIGGNTAIITPTITVDTSAYSAGDSIGGKITLTNALRESGGTGVLSGLTLIDRANQKPALEIFLFESDPSAATITNNAAFVFSTDDFKVIAKIVVAASDWTTINSKATAELANLNRVVKASGSRNLFAAIVATDTPTFAAATDLQARFKFLLD